ncbi:hypothetical protein TWF694_010780 [Orbilia ellipsospora]|uniref:Secreted protein n=1 Tax=Orbilia ellipsospora TaxID=2528407 RepID=A0AAV9X884_9PEZI
MLERVSAKFPCAILGCLFCTIPSLPFQPQAEHQPGCPPKTHFRGRKQGEKEKKKRKKRKKETELCNIGWERLPAVGTHFPINLKPDRRDFRRAKEHHHPVVLSN